MYLSGSYENLRKHFVARTTNATIACPYHILHILVDTLLFFSLQNLFA